MVEAEAAVFMAEIMDKAEMRMAGMVDWDHPLSMEATVLADMVELEEPALTIMEDVGDKAVLPDLYAP